MHPFFQQVHFQYIIAFALCAGAIGDLAMAIFSEKLVLDRVLRVSAAAIMTTFAFAFATSWFNGLLLVMLLVCGVFVQGGLFLRSHFALRAEQAKAPVVWH